MKYQIVLSSNPGSFIVDSLDCATVKDSFNNWISTVSVSTYRAVSCSSDPIKTGKIITAKVNFTGSTSNYTITSISEILDPTGAEAMDYSVFIVIAYVVLFFIGFHSGVSHGNR